MRLPRRKLLAMTGLDDVALHAFSHLTKTYSIISKLDILVIILMILKYSHFNKMTSAWP